MSVTVFNSSIHQVFDLVQVAYMENTKSHPSLADDRIFDRWCN